MTEFDKSAAFKDAPGNWTGAVSNRGLKAAFPGMVHQVTKKGRGTHASLLPQYFLPGVLPTAFTINRRKFITAQGTHLH